MARITIEDCLSKTKDRFELVMLAAERTRELLAGASSTMLRTGDKYTVTALREIAGGYDCNALREASVLRYRRGKIVRESISLSNEETNEFTQPELCGTEMDSSDGIELKTSLDDNLDASNEDSILDIIDSIEDDSQDIDLIDDNEDLTDTKDPEHHPIPRNNVLDQSKIYSDEEIDEDD